MKIIYKYFFIFFIISCKSSYFPSGKYVFKDNRSSTTLTLDSLSNFMYYSETELTKIYSEGKWIINKDTLFIKSNEAITEENGNVSEFINDSAKYTLLSFFDKDGNQLENLPVIINEADTIYSGKDGKIKIFKPVNSILVHYFDIYDFFYTKKNSNSNNLNIHLFTSNNRNKYFPLRKFLVKRKKIIDKKMTLVKE